MSEAHRPANIFAGAHLDRRSETREREDWYVEALAQEPTRFVIARGTAQLIHATEEPRIAFLDSLHPLVQQSDPKRQWTLLGWFHGACCVLVETDTDSAPPLPAAMSFEDLRPLASRLSAEEASVLAYARALSVWRARSRYCGICGAPTVPRSAGHRLHCSNPNCAEDYFPRLDPAIIVLVSDGERVLLGRQASWPAGRYSTLAGFVEPGESLEDAVVREVMEETGVQTFDLRYHSSQPWPFPSSLMLGFEARSEPRSRIRLNGELEDARWFTPAELASKIVMPTAHSISHRLISDWLASQQPAAGR